LRSQFQFSFTLDTEPDNLWANRPELTFEHFDRLFEFHRRMRAAGSKPVYLTTSEVVEDAKARAVLRKCLDEGGCEIGAHFHSWTRSWPFPVPDINWQGARSHAMAHQLGQGVEEAMLSYTCRELTSAYGVQPVSYRGGRWSLSRDSLTSFRNCGITVDSTVTPGISWRDQRHILVDGSDFSRSSRFPSSVSRAMGGGDDPQGPLEIPVGAAWFPAWGEDASDTTRKNLARIGARLPIRTGHRWLRPTHSSVEDMTAVMKSLKAASVPVWVFMIHSSEIAPCKPLPTEDDVRKFVDRCERIAQIAVELGAVGATLTEAETGLRGQVA
jgi:hypothetical protein